MADYIQDDLSLDEYYEDDSSTDTTQSLDDIPSEEDIDWLHDFAEETYVEHMDEEEPEYEHNRKRRRIEM